MTMWKPIAEFSGSDHEKVDLWLEIYASPRSMGWTDSFRVVDCWREGGKWFHYDNGKKKELFTAYVTYWMPTPQPPICNTADPDLATPLQHQGKEAR